MLQPVSIVVAAMKVVLQIPSQNIQLVLMCSHKEQHVKTDQVNNTQ